MLWKLQKIEITVVIKVYKAETRTATWYIYVQAVTLQVVHEWFLPS